MNDELLMRFIDGTATPEEVETVMAYLSKDGEAAKEWLQMVQATRLADTPPAMQVSEQDAERFVLSSLKKSEVMSIPSASKKVRRLPWILSGVAVAAAAAVALVVTLSFNGKQSSTNFIENGNLQAEVLPESSTPEPDASNLSGSDSVMILPKEHKSIDSKEYLAESKADEKTVIKPEAQKMLVEEISTANGAVNYEESSDESVMPAEFNVLKPAKSPYRVKVVNKDKDFVFEWECSSVAGVSLTIADSNGVVLLEKTVTPADGKLPVKAAELADRGELTWSMTAVFEDGNKVVRTGKIELVMD